MSVRAMQSRWKWRSWTITLFRNSSLREKKSIETLLLSTEDESGTVLSNICDTLVVILSFSPGTKGEYSIPRSLYFHCSQFVRVWSNCSKDDDIGNAGFSKISQARESVPRRHNVLIAQLQAFSNGLIKLARTRSVRRFDVAKMKMQDVSARLTLFLKTSSCLVVSFSLQTCYSRKPQWKKSFAGTANPYVTTWIAKQFDKSTNFVSHSEII